MYAHAYFLLGQLYCSQSILNKTIRVGTNLFQLWSDWIGSAVQAGPNGLRLPICLAMAIEWKELLEAVISKKTSENKLASHCDARFTAYNSTAISIRNQRHPTERELHMPVLQQRENILDLMRSAYLNI